MEYVKKIILIFTVLTFALSMLWKTIYASEQKVYDVVLNYDKGVVAKKSLVVTIGLFTDILDQPENGYLLQVKSFNNKILYAQKFSFDLIGQKILISNQKSFTIEEDEQELISPYFPNGKEIEIYDPQNKKILVIPVMQFAEVTPTPISPTPQYKVTRMEKGIGAPWIIGGVLLFVITAIGVFVYLRFKKPSRIN